MDDHPTPILPLRLYASVFAFFLGLFWLTNSGFDTSEARNHYRVAEHIVTSGQLGFADEQQGIFTRSPSGRWYASHEIGNTVLLLPAAVLNRAVIQRLLAQRDSAFVRYAEGFVISLHAGVYVAATLTAVFALLWRGFGLPLGTAALGALLLGVTTYLWTYSRNLFDGVLSGALLSGSVCLLFGYRTSRRLPPLMGAFALLGFGVVTRTTMVLAVAASVAYLLALEWKRPVAAAKPVLVGIMMVLPFVLWQTWYNKLRTGTPLLSPVETAQYAANNALDGPLLTGLAGLLFSPGKSIFVYAPLTLLSVVLFRRFGRRLPAEAVYVAVLSGLWLVVHAKLRNWYGAWGWGPRHFVTIVPVLYLPFAAELQTVLAKRWYRRAALLLGTWGLALAASSIVANWHFRMGLAYSQGRIDDRSFVWSLSNNQAADMVRALPGNLLRWLGKGPLLEVPDVSPLNTYASSTVNTWWNTMWHAGIPPFLILAVVALLMAVCALGAWHVASCVKRERGSPRFPRTAIGEHPPSGSA